MAAPWIFEDFISQLDTMGLAFIELNDIASWLKAFGFDLGIKISQMDVADALEKKLKVGPEEYQLNAQTDYYRGIETILNSEVAAMAKVMQLYSALDDD